ncbi:uncharacterized protein Z519_02337 [Cladophialophora bantiana CBS 173.52]|uniref:Uncharacterized protein n=1 Tax=Cladophialophora bantiana (strain ATCC 10958 / CBS 173.52 / CDC B-1940 / NIH 8579) TaxID=1442370 RepID=A0A0D2F409_CLAB1|nr:uncharacterized protein Z519_02337 [Cladophialophora bantiana CBS 173.52]KIW96946.1 hypothetical protein Z519_02337 [Cladophialophora bantiana CBS 173.52]
MAPPDPNRWTFTDYVCFLRSHGFHNLAGLDEFLQWGLEASRMPTMQRPQRATAILLEFGTSSFRTSDLTDTSKLRVLLKEWTRRSPETPPTSPASGSQGRGGSAQGRIIMVNNINPEMVDTLGSLLNIEPAFFASHIIDSAPGGAGDGHTGSPLASQNLRHQKNFFTIEYPCTFMTTNCGKDVDIEKLYCKGNYHRRVEVCSKHGKQKVAVARRKISFYMKKTLDPWICVVLVDPPISFFTLGAEPYGVYSPSQRLEVTGYQGGYLDFLEQKPPLNRNDHDYRLCGARPMCPNPFDDLCRHWQIMARDGLFNPAEKNMINVMRPAFQIAASECTNFFDYIRSTLESQLISTALTVDPTKTKRILDKVIFLDSMLSRYKPILTRIKTYLSSDSELNEDYRSLLIDLHHYRAECDSQMQHILAVSQCQDTSSLRSIEADSQRQADYSRYLTIIALIYAPFALACAIFTLPHDFAPGAHYFYGLLPATAGVAIVFLLLVLPEARDPLPSIKAAFCGKLTKKKLLAKPSSRGSRSGTMNEKMDFDEV